ncbi:MAG: UDP-N-acetylmuramate dehydrogenase [Oscillospiraceae bacterium]|nr:UDP-N-acetylmuramate dehydrogenase [Oscillospiraceae bacterium]
MVQTQNLLKEVKEYNIEISSDVVLAPYTSFKIGGPAKWFCSPKNEEELKTILSLCKKYNVRYYFFGRGSNVLFADEGFDGVIIHIGTHLSDIKAEGNHIIAQAGAPLAQICNTAAENGLAGLEFAFGIPGCLGGAVFMNAGAYGGEMKDVVESVTYINYNGEIVTKPGSELEFGYRTSCFQHNGGCILQARLSLETGDKAAIQEKMQGYLKSRADKQPLDMPSAGSAFKRPVGAFAGQLIQECGLRGFSVGGAAISTKHCGFVVNTGNATCKDVLTLADEVCRIVTEKTGFTLEKEIRVVR